MDIFVTDSPEREHIELIDAGLDEYNLAQAGVVDHRKLAVLARAPDTGEVVGGLIGRTSLGLLFVELLYLPAEYRGTGLGAQLLAAAEREAVNRGCRTGVLYTISFQAPDFYVKQGWQVFGEVPTDNGISRVFLSKTLG
ncbi:GNAT family N-acetyltransferase [Kutzneria chonburiensis]|uniref:GNAT family N-acetyltransferase n=1 Tax=Kutzneria chonburiensis TaxID=1483604 RepID=A0ABV6N103_9PSEU|nr:GNAT family N-acetyltransferase [Kutzneria chonburiensis]